MHPALPTARPLYRVRSAEVPAYSPAHHAHTRNQRLIGPDTVGARQLEVLLGTLSPGGSALPHAHPGVEQVCYVLEGTARATVAGQCFDLQVGDCCFFPADEMHTVEVTGTAPLKLLVIYSPPYGENPALVRRP
ncbi:MAG: cupin domain-containing protein [Curvibacter sp.]|nr:cupin domain-containing protein [Curvibacter sp.]